MQNPDAHIDALLCAGARPFVFINLDGGHSVYIDIEHIDPDADWLSPTDAERDGFAAALVRRGLVVDASARAS